MFAAGIALAAALRRGPLAALRERLQWHPEAWPLAMSAAAWLLLVGQSRVPSPALAFCGKLPVAAAMSFYLAVPATLAGASLMIAAMMLPLLVPTIRHVAFASLWRRRHRAVAGFLIGFGALWLVAAGLPLGIIAVLPVNLSRPEVAGAAFAMAALWQLSPLKRRALSLCHRTIPLRPNGWRADWDCLRFGAIHARACIASCCAMMLAAGLAMDHLAVMAAVTAVAALERYRPRRNHRAEALLLAIPALACAASAIA